MYCPPAYQGSDPYIFVSYAHLDGDTVLPIIEHLTEEGFRVWYDAGIEAGTEWPEYIAERLDESDCVIAFLSRASLNSKNCKREINFALELDKNVLAVYLEDLELTRGMRMQLNSLQALYRSRHRREEAFFEALTGAQLLQNCRQHGEDDPVIASSAPNEKVWDINTVWEPEDEPDYQLYVRTEDTSYRDVLDLALDSIRDKGYEAGYEGIELAAICGIPEAMAWLGVYYENGYGVEIDYEKSFYWCKSAAINGDPRGTYLYGQYVMFGKHDVVEKDYWKGVSIQRKGAELGSPHAMWELGQEYGSGYYKGHDMPHDWGLSEYWQSKAKSIVRQWVEQGNQDAKYLLYYRGDYSYWKE